MTTKKASGSKLKENSKMSSQEVNNLASEQPLQKSLINESLVICGICLDVMHNSMNVTPCNHKFCAGCIYEWHSQQDNCPTCRWYVMDITRDAMASEVIQAFLVANPDKNRSEECKNRLDERELFHLEQYEAAIADESSDSNNQDSNEETESTAVTADSEMAVELLEDDDSDDFMSDGDDEFSDMSELFGDSDDEGRELEIKARRDIDAARIIRLRAELEERQLAIKEAEEMNKKNKKKTRKRNNNGAITSTTTESSASNKRSRSQSEPE